MQKRESRPGAIVELFLFAILVFKLNWMFQVYYVGVSVPAWEVNLIIDFVYLLVSLFHPTKPTWLYIAYVPLSIIALFY